VPDASETSGVPGDAAELHAENARLRESAGRLRLLVEDKDAKIAELEERIARLERLISRNSGFSEQSKSSCKFVCCHRSGPMRIRWHVC
jgi:hypothetical protein